MIQFFKNIFHRKTSEALPSAKDMIQTAPLDAESEDPAAGRSPYRPAQFLVGCAQSVGIQRDHNEDTLFAMSSVLADGVNDIPFGIFIIADGMGGHQYGEIASGVAARTMANHLLARVYQPLTNPDLERSNDSLQELMEAGVREAHQIVLRKAPGGGTTLTAALLLGEQITIAHVGDSRAYFIYSDGRIRPLTQDHSLVHRLVELGQLTEEQAVNHPNKNVLYRVLGQTEPFRPDIENRMMPHPGYLMVCSDGLWGVLPEDDLLKIVQQSSNPTEACHQLVEAANDAGGPDNISVILVQFL